MRRTERSKSDGNGERPLKATGNGQRSPKAGGNGQQRAESPEKTVRVQPLIETEVILARGPASTLEVQPKPTPPQRGFASLRVRSFRLFWLGQAVSLTGVWMQVIAQAILVLQLTGSALVLGIITALQFLPILLLSVFGGLLADQLPRRQVLVVTQSAAMLLAFILFGLTAAGVVQVIHVAALATLLGIVNAVDLPTRQAFVIDLVPREYLANAVALNSAVFNGSRLVGPAIGGLVIGVAGIAIGFLANAVTFIPAIIALLVIQVTTAPTARGVEIGAVWRNLSEGFRYVRDTAVARLVVILVGVVGLFGMNLNVIIPVQARDVLAVGPAELGILLAALGVGALGAALGLAFLGWEPHPRLLLMSAGVFGVAEVILALVRSFLLALPLLVVVGFFMVLLITLSNITLQTTTPDALRGRVLSVFTTVFAGTAPIGSFIAGAVAQALGVPAAFLLGGVASVVVALLGCLLLAGCRQR